MPSFSGRGADPDVADPRQRQDRVGDYRTADQLKFHGPLPGSRAPALAYRKHHKTSGGVENWLFSKSCNEVLRSNFLHSSFAIPLENVGDRPIWGPVCQAGQAQYKPSP
jgi:hypothetical protein